MNADATEFLAVSKICNRQNLSVKLVLSFLSDSGVIPVKGKRHEKEFVRRKGLDVHSTGDSLRLIEDDLMRYLDKKGVLPTVSLIDELNVLHDTIEDPKFRFEQISKVVHSRIAFIDAEFKDGNYHEVAWEIREDGKVVDKKYFIVREEYMKKVKIVDDKVIQPIRIRKLQEANYPFVVTLRKHINRIMKNDMKSVDRIVAHGAQGERNMLIQNGIRFKKSKFLCTSNMMVGYVYDRQKMPSLNDLVAYYGIPVNSNFLHYAHEDARVAAEVFYTIIESAKKEFGIS